MEAYKNPIHEVVSVLPTDKATGYRVILTTDNIIYERQSDGSWLADTNFGYGSACVVIGQLGNKSNFAIYLNADTFSEKVTPFFGTGNDLNIVKSVYWGERLVVARADDANENFDLIVIFSNGDSKKLSSIAAGFIDMVVDSRSNLWVATDAGFHKFMFDSSDMQATIYTSALGSLPFDTIAGIACFNEKLWIMSTDSDAIEIAYYNGYEWTELTAQFFSDTGITVVPETFAVTLYKMFCDQSGNLLFTLNQNSTTPGNLFVYSVITESFTIKELPDDFTMMHDFVKVGNNVYGLDHATEQASGKFIIFDYNLGTILHKAATAMFSNIVTDLTNVIAFSTTHIYAIETPSVTPAELTTWLDEMETLLGESAKIHIINIFPAVNKFCILNIASQDNMIIENKLTPGWITKG